MAHKADEVKHTETGKPNDIQPPLSKTKFTLLIFALMAIIILLSVILILLSFTNISNNATAHNGHNETNEFENTTMQQQIPGTSYKLIFRAKWGGRSPLYERPQNVPIKYVIISHTAGAECFSIESCSTQMERIQTMHIGSGSPDIGYNFLVGGDANIYVGRGWDNHNFHMNLDTIGISFIGNYIFNVLSPEMIDSTQQLLKIGVETGKLDKDYILVPHNQTYSTVSPGTNVYKQIKFWPHYSKDILTDVDV